MILSTTQTSNIKRGDFMLQAIETCTQPPLPPQFLPALPGRQRPLVDPEWIGAAIKRAALQQMWSEPLRARQARMLLWGDSRSVGMAALVARMLLGDRLESKTWGLEYVEVEGGAYPHYRLRRRKDVLGIRDVTSPRMLAPIHRGLGILLASLGWRPDRTFLIAGGAEVSDGEKKHRLPTLFTVGGERRKGRKPANMMAEVFDWMPWEIINESEGLR
jgi:hypothetical protein